MNRGFRKWSSSLLACVGVLVALGVAWAYQQQDFRDVICMAHAKQLTLGIMMYTQDYDETFPRSRTPQELREVVFPYVKSARVFICPAVNRLFQYNRALIGKSIGMIEDPATTEVLRDSRPHRDRQYTIAYMNLKVVHPGVENVSAEDILGGNGGGSDPNGYRGCQANVRQLGVANAMYTQDYDERLAPMYSYDLFREITMPYVKNEEVYICPSTHLDYVLNAALSYTLLNDWPDKASTLVLWDAQPHRDGKSTYGYLDGHVEQK